MSRVRDIYLECDGLQARLDTLHAELRAIRLAAAREAHPCTCVALNRDIEVYDGAEQVARRRTGLQLGLVADTLSAWLDCPVCRGSGTPPSPGGQPAGSGEE